MGVPGNADLLLLKTAAAAGGYQVSRSLRFNSADSAGLSRTFGSAGNRTTWTLSFWTKISSINTSWFLLRVAFGNNDNDHFNIILNTTGTLQISGYNTVWRTTTQVFRDFSAWYHFVIVADTNNGTPDNRLRLYVNGSEITTFSTKNNPSSGATFGVNAAQTHYISEANGYINGYLADIWFLDGIAATPSDFAETDATTGQWIPKTYSGSKGSNGFHLEFADNSNNTASTLGKDTANSNNWTPNNFSVTAGAGNDSLVDTPTSYGTGNSGGDVRGNFCTLNPLKMGSFTLSNGNLDCVSTSSYGLVLGTIGMSSGKWYFETTLNGSGAANSIGIATDAVTITQYPGYDSLSWVYLADGRKINGGSRTSYGASFTTGDVIGVAFDADAGSLTFYKNGSSQGTAFTGLTSGPYFPVVGDDSSGSQAEQSLNFGQRTFAYTAPSGFKALCDTNLTAPVIAKPSTVMDVKLYTATDGVSGSVSGVNFSPDFVWIKSRAVARSNVLMDTVRGTSSVLWSNLTDAQLSSSQYVSQFNSDGFNYGVAGDVTNGSTVAWMWDAGTSTVTNTQGSITSSVRANASAGFSIVSYNSGSSTGNVTLGHGLNVAPKFIIHKSRSTSNWWVYHASVIDDLKKYMQLNSTNAIATNSNNMWGGAFPTSSVFGVTVGDLIATSQDAIAYVFSPVAGYSSMGSYVGNGSSTSGPFVYLGFRPRFLLVKSSTGAENWDIYDSSRGSYNLNNLSLQPNLSGAEYNAGSLGFDFLSNGFRSIGGSNTNGATYIYFAVAESPFAYSRAR